MNTSRFSDTLLRHGLELNRGATSTLQVNVGLMCDLACRHCHLEGGPDRVEAMGPETVEAVIACAERFNFAVIDITGGAPEMLPMLPRLISGLAPQTAKLIVRTNLTALTRPECRGLPELYRDHGVALTASLPAANAAQTEAQRGVGVWEASIAMIRRLNGLGYGVAGSNLLLDLVSNPTGAFLPAPQGEMEKRFRQSLERRYGISFNNLYTFANVPLGRFRAWLERSGNLDVYLAKLERNFNPCTLTGLMCRSQLLVNWDGFIYDCDFNLAVGLHHGGRRTHIAQLSELPAAGCPIPVGDHCFACTAGSGFT